MSNDRSPSTRVAPNPRSASLTAASAFVVHLMADGTSPEHVGGRIEHVVSGRSAWFATADELIGFMQQALRHEAEAEPLG